MSSYKKSFLKHSLITVQIKVIFNRLPMNHINHTESHNNNILNFRNIIFYPDPLKANKMNLYRFNQR